MALALVGVTDEDSDYLVTGIRVPVGMSVRLSDEYRVVVEAGWENGVLSHGEGPPDESLSRASRTFFYGSVGLSYRLGESTPAKIVPGAIGAGIAALLWFAVVATTDATLSN